MKTIGFTVDPSRLPNGRFKDLLKRYDEIGFVKHMPGFIVNGLPIHLEPSYHRIGVFLSGGADSAMLLYILCRAIHELKLPTKIVCATVIRRWEMSEHTEKAKDDVIAYVDKLFPGIIVGRENGFLPSCYELTKMSSLVFSTAEAEKFSPADRDKNADTYYFFMFGRWVTRRHKLDAFYGGTTTNPTEKVLNEAPEFRSPEVLNFSNVSLHKHEDHYSGVTFRQKDPFFFIEKSWVTAQFKNFDIEDLLKLTKSCECNADGCGECFHCQERDWSLKTSASYLEENCALRAELQTAL